MSGNNSKSYSVAIFFARKSAFGFPKIWKICSFTHKICLKSSIFRHFFLKFTHAIHFDVTFFFKSQKNFQKNLKKLLFFVKKFKVISGKENRRKLKICMIFEFFEQWPQICETPEMKKSAKSYSNCWKSANFCQFFGQSQKSAIFRGFWTKNLSSEIQNFYLQPKSKICQFQINLQIWQHFKILD